MKPTEVRQSILTDHEGLRVRLESLERQVQATLRGQALPPGALRHEAEALLTALSSHMDFEDRHLAPALAQADAWGDERSARLESDHAEQRELLAYQLRQLDDASRPERLVAANLADLIALLRNDMQEEEEALLDEQVLRDDVVGIDVNSG